MTPTIALTTDFGSGSSYVAQMKGVLLSSLPEARMVDVSHDVPPQSIREAALLLRGVAFAFPLGTVHVVVIDPGVGSERRGIAVQSGGMFFVGPDNGVLGAALSRPDAQCVHLDKEAFFRQPVSPTFHGRDIFAPVAAELAAGLSLQQVGSPLSAPLTSNLPDPTCEGDTISGEVLGADRFGNLLTNLPGTLVHQGHPLNLGRRVLPWVTTYAEAPEKTLVALIGSDGYVEVAIRDGSALKRCGQSVIGKPLKGHWTAKEHEHRG